MYLKRLEIFGFKSFAEKTVLNFEPGITAIVGPNGCGKSNIFDAIRWVLGEQSIKELRGAAMEDVIFNGTDSKPGLGFAEVSLTFSNESRLLLTEYDEVTVTRRLFRSGESEYLLNKTVVRLKDILELFMGTGIGAEAYSLVQQGRVDLIVSAHPEDRRFIIDEAAGITKYKSKKKEALSKLQDTENNLLRINDIILEVKRQIASIERQANKARRYKEEFENLKNLEVKFARFQIANYVSQASQLSTILESLKEEELRIAQDAQTFEQNIEQETDVLNGIEIQMNNVRSEDIRIENDIELHHTQISFNDERIHGLLQSDEKIKYQIAQLQERGRLQQEKIDSLNSALSALVQSLQTNRETLATKKESLISIADKIKAAKETIKADEENILNLTSQQVKVKNDMTEVMKEFQGCLARKRRLDLENDKILSERSDVDSRLMTIQKNIDECLEKVHDFKNQQEIKNQKIDQCRERQHSIETTVDDLERKVLGLRSQREFIEKLQVQYHDLSEPAQENTILSSTPLEIGRGLIGKIKDVRPVDLHAIPLLKEKLSSLQGQELYEIICETKFIELDPHKITEKVDELSRAIDIQVVEKERSSLEMQNEQQQLKDIQAAIHDLERTFSSYEAQRNNIADELKKLTGEMELVSFELTESRQSLAVLKNKEDELSHQFEEISLQMTGIQNGIREKQYQIAWWGQQREETTVSIAQLETEIELSLNNQSDQQENLKIFEAAFLASFDEVKRLEQDMSAHEVKRSEIRKESEDLTLKIEELNSKRTSLIEAISQHEFQKSDVIKRIDELKRQVNGLHKQIEEIKLRTHNQQLQNQQISFDEKSIKDRLLQTYKVNVDEFLAQDQTQESAQEFNSGQAAVDIEQLRKKCESYGSVNLVAIEEFDELKQRFEFLTKQQSDLLTAKDSLEQTIGKINRTTRQLFLDTFTKVSEEFRIYFRMLFGGGEAQLLLSDPENVLESSIEIIARPPGKKLQNISLMSGGEKTLAAIALIFGVFKVRPSPFCVLDEIDAALDESNVGRFSYLLKDFARIAQFVVITHNKKTIASADIMYGITMQQTGVSKIVSVKFAQSSEKEKQKDEEAAVAA